MRIFAILAVAASVVGCAAVTRGTTQVVAVNTPDVADASCTLTAGAVGTQTVVTPATVTLQKGRDNVAVHYSNEWYQDGTGVIASNIEGMTAGNIIVGGVIGIGVDAASGAMNSYAPGIQGVMAPIPGVGRRGRRGRAARRTRERSGRRWARHRPAPHRAQSKRSHGRAQLGHGKITINGSSARRSPAPAAAIEPGGITAYAARV